MTYLYVTDESERDRIISEIDAAYGYPHPETLTEHAVMWQNHPDGPGSGWIIPIPDTFIYSHQVSERVDLVSVLADVTPDLGVTRDVDPETGDPSQPLPLADQSSSVVVIDPHTGKPVTIQKAAFWITEDDANSLGFFPDSTTPKPSPVVPVKPG